MDDIFATVSSNVPTIDESKDYLAELVGEGKKFADVAALAKGKAHADVAIDVLKAQLDEVKQDLKQRMTFEELADKINSGGTQNAQAVSQVIPASTEAPIGESLDERLEAALSQREAKLRAEANRDRVIKTLTDQFGDTVTAQRVVNAKAQALGMSPQDLQNIGVRSPSALFGLLGVTEGRTPLAPGVAVSTVSFNGNPDAGVVLKDMKYFQDLKKSNPALYNDKKTTVEMMKAAESMGLEKFHARVT